MDDLKSVICLDEWELAELDALDALEISRNGQHPAEPPDVVDLEPDPAAVVREYRRIVARHEAQQLWKAARSGELAVPEPRNLADWLTEPDDPVRYRVAGWWPANGRVMLSASQKTGKTTLVGNLVRALADDVPFLGCCPVEPVTGSIVVIDNEMSQGMLKAWYRDIGVARADRVELWSLRGRGSSFNLLDPDVRDRWAERLRTIDAAVLVLDCLNPALTTLGLSESSNDDTGRFLAAFDELLVEAGIPDALIAHHMGHEGERARGASKLRGWPEVEWRYVRDKDDEGQEVDAGRRYLAAYGRDVDVAESALGYDPDTRRLELLGGTRGQRRAGQRVETVVDIVRRHTEANGPYSVITSEIKAQLGVGNNAEATAVIEQAVREGRIHWRKEGTAKRYALGEKPLVSGTDMGSS